MADLLGGPGPDWVAGLAAMRTGASVPARDLCAPLGRPTNKELRKLDRRSKWGPERLCRRCGTWWLLLEDFAKHKGGRLGRLGVCNQCRNADKSEAREEQVKKHGRRLW